MRTHTTARFFSESLDLQKGIRQPSFCWNSEAMRNASREHLILRILESHPRNFQGKKKASPQPYYPTESVNVAAACKLSLGENR